MKQDSIWKSDYEEQKRSAIYLKKLEQVFEVVKYPTKDYPTRKDPQLIHWYVTVKLREEDQKAS